MVKGYVHKMSNSVHYRVKISERMVATNRSLIIFGEYSEEMTDADRK